jgi:AraC-like DNA-binding protein/fumarate reductase subunit D
MYSHLFFGITLLGLFSIFDNFKGLAKISDFKFHVLFLLSFLTIGSFLFFLNENGYNSSTLRSIARIGGTVSLLNVFYILAVGKISKTVVYLEGILSAVYLSLFFFGFQYLEINDGKLNIPVNIFHKINLVLINLLVFISLFINLFRINKNTDKYNMYHVKVRKWCYFLVILLSAMFIITVLNIVFFKYTGLGFNPDTRIMFITIYLLILLFLAFRPKFIDDTNFSDFHQQILSTKQADFYSEFEFLFYKSHYYLQPDANLDDFALKLNQPKAEITEFIRIHTNESFIELLNRNRVKHFEGLLMNNKQDSFTIEALSAMSGFSNRRNMYNAFKKYNNMTPTEFIIRLN